jgi:hypothetical protein
MAIEQEIVDILEHLIGHSPVSPTDKKAWLARLEGVRDPATKAAREAAREQEEQRAIQAQIDELQKRVKPAARTKQTAEEVIGA